MSDTGKDRIERLSKIPLFGRLEPAELEEVHGLFEEVNYLEGEEVCRAGEEGDTFFIVLSGRLNIWTGGEDGRLVGEFGPGDCFGERALIFDEPRSATIQVAEDARLLALREEPFETFLLGNPATSAYLDEVRREQRIERIAMTPLFSFLDKDELIEIEKIFSEDPVGPEETVFTAGDAGDRFYVILSGEFEVISLEGKIVGSLGPPNFFGELSLLLNEPRSATIKSTAKSRLLHIGKEAFEHFFADNKRAMSYFSEIRQNRQIQILEQIPLFSSLSPSELAVARGLFVERKYERGEIICKAGEEGDAFYVVRYGELEVWGGSSNRQLLNTLGPSDFFGEESLVLNEPRTASVFAAAPTSLLVLERAPFERFFLRNEKAVAYLLEVGHRRRAAALDRIPLFRYLEPEELEELHKLFTEETYRKGAEVCHAGDESDRFYIVLSGELAVWSAHDEPRWLARLQAGDFFGELALVLGETRVASVVATQRTKLLCLDKVHFNRFFMRNPRALEYFAKVICQRLSSAVGSEQQDEGVIQIAVAGQPGLKGKTMVATALAELLSELTGRGVLLVHLHQVVADRSAAEGMDLHLAQIRRSIDHVLRSVERNKDGVVRLQVGIEPGGNPELYGTQLSELVNRLQDHFAYQVFDLECEPKGVAESAPDFADVLVEIVERADPWFDRMSRSAAATQLVRYPVVNLYNSSSRRMPINSCVPFVLPRDDAFARDGISSCSRRSPVGIPLVRLARKILGKTVGLALGGGAAFGLSHLGVLKVLEDEGIPIDVMVGCSMGSLIAVSYAAGYRVEEMIYKAHEMGRTEYMASGVDIAMSLPGLIAGNKFKQRFTPLLGDCQTFDDLLIPCRTVATDIRSGELVTIGRGKLEDAYRASSSVPTILSPLALAGRTLVDGGVADPVPAETARSMGADVCIAVNVVPPLKLGVENVFTKLSSSLNRFNPLSWFGESHSMPNTLDIVMNSMQILQHELGAYKAISADVTIQPDLSDFTWTDFNRCGELVEKGKEATERALPEILKIVSTLKD